MADPPDSEVVTRLPVAFRDAPGEDAPCLHVVNSSDSRLGCNHQWAYRNDGSGNRMVSATYRIRQGETEVECGLCSGKLDPMWVLQQLARNESRWLQNRLRAQEEQKRLSERERTKCEHCKQMTRISRAKPRARNR